MSQYENGSRDWLAEMAAASLGDFELTRAVDADLSRRALAAQRDPAARDELFALLAMKARRFVSRYRRWSLDPWELADVLQEAYLAYHEVLMVWKPLTSGTGTEPAGFGLYFVSVFPRRLSDRVRALLRYGRDRPAPLPWIPERDARLEPFDVNDETQTRAVMADICGRLNAADSTIFQQRAAGRPPDDIARAASISRRTFYRRWSAIASIAREELAG